MSDVISIRNATAYYKLHGATPAPAVPGYDVNGRVITTGFTKLPDYSSGRFANKNVAAQVVTFSAPHTSQAIVPSGSRTRVATINTGGEGTVNLSLYARNAAVLTVAAQMQTPTVVASSGTKGQVGFVQGYSRFAPIPELGEKIYFEFIAEADDGEFLYLHSAAITSDFPTLTYDPKVPQVIPITLMAHEGYGLDAVTYTLPQ